MLVRTARERLDGKKRIRTQSICTDGESCVEHLEIKLQTTHSPIHTDSRPSVECVCCRKFCVVRVSPRSAIRHPHLCPVHSSNFPSTCNDIREFTPTTYGKNMTIL